MRTARSIATVLRTPHTWQGPPSLPSESLGQTANRRHGDGKNAIHVQRIRQMRSKKSERSRANHGCSRVRSTKTHSQANGKVPQLLFWGFIVVCAYNAQSMPSLCWLLLQASRFRTTSSVKRRSVPSSSFSTQRCMSIFLGGIGRMENKKFNPPQTILFKQQLSSES